MKEKKHASLWETFKNTLLWPIPGMVIAIFPLFSPKLWKTIQVTVRGGKLQDTVPAHNYIFLCVLTLFMYYLNCLPFIRDITIKAERQRDWLFGRSGCENEEERADNYNKWTRYGMLFAFYLVVILQLTGKGF